MWCRSGLYKYGEVDTMIYKLIGCKIFEREIFLIVPPGKQAVQSYDEDIIKVEEA